MKTWKRIGPPIAIITYSKMKNDLLALIISHVHILIKTKKKCWNFSNEVRSVLAVFHHLNYFFYSFNLSQWVKVKYTTCRSHFKCYCSPLQLLSLL